MKKVGCVTDQSFNRALWKLPFEKRILYFKEDPCEQKLNEGLDFLYSLKRLPRVFLDEYNNKGE